MTSRIAPIATPTFDGEPVVRTADDDVALCERCTAILGGPMSLDLSMLRLRGARVLLDKVAAVGTSEEHLVGDGTLYAPGQTERIRRTFGIEGVVLAIGNDIDSADISVGARVIIDEFAGRPVHWNGRRLPYWIVADGEVMCVVTDDADVSSAVPDTPAEARRQRRR